MYIYITTNLVVKDVINKYMSRTSYILGKKKSPMRIIVFLL